MDRVVVNQVHMFLKRMMHEGNTISAPRIVQRYRITPVFEPLDLVSLNAAHTSIAHAVCTPCTKEPQTRIRFRSI
jgi:hypothetical protein